ncbi:CAP domain-containing protein [Pseudomonas sp. HR96]|uniref:CAP domain-containing protein n=1 Tax=Pseudomonas sp. HR96 TaxID=1027966 RepID=UPI002A75A92A|nr:CAP domain-containing protein [Pseudomonas sp. HR96]WPO98062.1 CAP domain-containing protein [Pseudomonas sp. HR96]
MLRPVLLLLAATVSSAAVASEESQLADSINAYRGQVQKCGSQASPELPPLSLDTRLILPATGKVDLRAAMAQARYPMANVRAITLSGPRDAASALQVVQESFCQVVLDPQFINIGVSRDDREWRIVLGRPLLAGKLEASQAEGRKVLAMINSARAQPRQCGAQAFGAAPPLNWNATLASVADAYSRNMANLNYFDHQGRDGSTPGDRAELAGYAGQQVGENIAAGYDSARKVVDGWIASPGHCANLMNPAFKELGVGYGTDPKSDAGIYWTADFGG